MTTKMRRLRGEDAVIFDLSPDDAKHNVLVRYEALGGKPCLMITPLHNGRQQLSFTIGHMGQLFLRLEN